MILKRILFLFTSVALLAGCSSGRAPEIRAICLRDDIGNYIIKWETDPHTDGTMKLYVSDTPNSFDMSRPCSYADINDGRVTYITNDNITRKYFLLSFNDKYYRTVGARSVQMDSVQNLRDIGGYFSEQFGKALKVFLDKDNYPILVNCSMGKDRAGFLTAMLLTALDVPEETIMKDYMASNNHIDLRSLAYMARNLNTDAQETITVLLGANETWLDLAFHKIKKEYGSTDKYLSKGLHLTEKERDTLKDIILN